jgi:hypothetical protein
MTDERESIEQAHLCANFSRLLVAASGLGESDRLYKLRDTPGTTMAEWRRFQADLHARDASVKAFDGRDGWRATDVAWYRFGETFVCPAQARCSRLERRTDLGGVPQCGVLNMPMVWAD